MANLTIKKLPDPVYRRLKKHARLHGRSLNAQVIHMLQSDLNEHARFERMRESADELERLVASIPPMEDSTRLIREDRERDT
jgi:plasmid stability protein